MEIAMLQHRRFLTHLVRGYPNSERVENRFFFFFVNTQQLQFRRSLSRPHVQSTKKRKRKNHLSYLAEFQLGIALYSFATIYQFGRPGTRSPAFLFFFFPPPVLVGSQITGASHRISDKARKLDNTKFIVFGRTE